MAAINSNEINTHFSTVWHISQENIYLQITEHYCLLSQVAFAQL